MKNCLLLLALWLSLPLFAVDAEGEKMSSAIMFKQLNTTDGLSNNSVRCLFRDSRGFLWIGTESGLNKYDGYAFRPYYRSNSNLPGDAVQEVFEDPEKDVWVRLSEGYAIYDYVTGRFDNNYRQRLERLQIPGRNILRVGSAEDGEFWACDQDKLYLRATDLSGVKTFPLRNVGVFNVQIGTQKIYVMYNDARLFAIDKQTSQADEVMIPAVYRRLLARGETDLYIGSKDDLWVYTYRNSLLLHKVEKPRDFDPFGQTGFAHLWLQYD